MLPGVNYPANGVRFYQEDHNFEQEQKSKEIINRTKDSFSGAIVEGGNVTVGTGTTVNIEKTIAYDNSGNRIEVPATTNFNVPDNANSKIIIRYKEKTIAQPKPDGNSIEYRYPDYEIIARTGSLISGDIPLRQIQVINGVVTILDDLRDWRQVKDISIVRKSSLGENFKGFQIGILQIRSSNPNVITVPKWNVYEVKNKLIQIPNSLSLDFGALVNIFRSDGVTPISSTSEIQNKHLYLLLSDTGSLSAMLVPDSELPGASHSYNVNPRLLSDYYSATPSIWNPDENGYYKNNKRIIATLRVNTSNQIEFYYELGFGHRFLDVLYLPIGAVYTEIRYKREHPACYIPDGSSVTNMSSEAPVLHRILGTNVLPNWSDRFARNVNIASSRALRDLQEDAFQGHWHRVYSMSTINDTYGVKIQSGNINSNTDELARVDSYYNGATLEARNIISDGVNGTPNVANETRPRNFALMYQIVRG